MSAASTDFGAWYASQQAAQAGAAAASGSAPTSSSSSSSSMASASAGVAAAFGSFLPGGAPASLAAGGERALAAASGAVASASAGVSSVLRNMGVPSVPSLSGGGWGAVPTSAPGGDVESGSAGSGGGDSASGGAAEASGSGAAAYLPSGLLRLVGAGGGGSGAASSAPEWTCGLSLLQRVQLSMLLLGSSFVLFFVSIFMYLPVAILFPSKFATAFTFASLMWMVGTALMRGPRATLMGFLSRARLPFAAAYLGSIALTLYATIIAPSYLLIMFAVAVQFSALGWYSASFVPGGGAGMAWVQRGAVSVATSAARGLAGAILPAGLMGR